MLCGKNEKLEKKKQNLNIYIERKSFEF